MGNIRIPKELKEIVPLVSGQSPFEQTYKYLTGTPFFGKCVLGQEYVHSFDKKTYSYQIDECDHLITSDCSKDQEHAILAKEVNGHKHITIFESKTKITLRPAQAYHNFVENWSLEVDDKKVSLNKNEKKTIKIESDSLLKGEVTLYWHSDNVAEVNTPHSRITHKECVLSTNKLAAKSYRVKSSQCKPLPESISNKIRSEEEKCNKQTTMRAEVSSIYRKAGQDLHHSLRHSVITQEDKVCFSREQLVHCINRSQPRELRDWSLNYVCFPNGDEAEF